MTYQVKLDIFEGPLDLLLHLIKKDEVDIYDIPIAEVTEQYLKYIEMMKELNLEFAGEFLLMAATLIHIKSRMLLPVTEEAQEEGPDPREELVRRLLEYQRFKEAAEDLAGRPLLGRDVFHRGEEEAVEGAPEPVTVSIFELLGAIRELLERAPREKAIELTAERFRIADKINYVLEALGRSGSVEFLSLFQPAATRGEIIVTFLAVLELCKLLMIKVNQTEDGIIRVYARTPGEEGGA